MAELVKEYTYAPGLGDAADRFCIYGAEGEIIAEAFNEGYARRIVRSLGCHDGLLDLANEFSRYLSRIIMAALLIPPNEGMPALPADVNVLSKRISRAVNKAKGVSVCPCGVHYDSEAFTECPSCKGK